MDQKKLVTVSWKKCCLKTEEGGLGLINLKSYNKASNLCLCWKFLNKDKAWSKLLAAKVMRDGKFINYSIKSSLWKGFKEHADFVLDNTRWTLGNG